MATENISKSDSDDQAPGLWDLLQRPEGASYQELRLSCPGFSNNEFKERLEFMTQHGSVNFDRDTGTYKSAGEGENRY
jgi:hypothetical protein